jgi:integrase
MTEFIIKNTRIDTKEKKNTRIDTKEKIFQSMDRLEARTKFYETHSISENSRRAYEKDWSHFVIWCIRHEAESLPAEPDTVAAYFTDLADSGSKVATIARRSTSISVIHTASCYLSPCKTAVVARVLKGIRKTCGTPAGKSRPISWEELKRMISKCDSSSIGRRDAALLLIGWCGALRRSELISINYGDLQLVDEGLLIMIRRSKTDQEGEGQTIALPKGTEPYCPVSAFKEFASRLMGEREKSSPLFCKLGIKNRKNWWYTLGPRLNDRMISIIVKHYGSLIGLPTEFLSAHSLRRGFATECGSHALPERLIARHTRHRSLEVLRGYIDDGSIWRENPLPFIYGSRKPQIVSSSAAV